MKLEGAGGRGSSSGTTDVVAEVDIVSDRPDWSETDLTVPAT